MFLNKLFITKRGYQKISPAIITRQARELKVARNEANRSARWRRAHRNLLHYNEILNITRC
jgi:hypothetical protein